MWQRCMLWKIENGFYWLIYFHCEYVSAEKFENVVFEAKLSIWADTVLKIARGQFWNLLTLIEMHSLGDAKLLSWTHLLSLPTFDCSKIPKCCFLTKMIRFTWHSFEKWAWSVWNLLTLIEMYGVKDKKWFSLTRLISLRIFEGWKIRKCCFWSKIIHLSRHSFEKWAWSVSKFAYFNRDA